MTTYDGLLAVRALLSAPERWTQGYFACDSTGTAVDFSCDDATRFCVLGAILRVADNAPSFIRSQMRARIAREANSKVHYFNDSPLTTHADILRVLDQAIAAEQPR